MIPVYQAIEFKGIMKGGSSRPWQVTVLVDGTPVSYVVKIYNEAHNEQNCTVFKECVCSRLAKEFDLETPDAALIEFTAPFIANLPAQVQSALENKDPRVKFATKLISSPYQNYSSSLGEAFLKNYETGTVYAFDNLILNVDRRTDKPNLFFKDGRIVLFDHELSLTTTQNAEKALIGNGLWAHLYKDHVFHRGLRYMDDEDREGIFDEFSCYLGELIDFDFIDSIADQLIECGHPADAYVAIKKYLRAAQEKATKFVELLENTIK